MSKPVKKAKKLAAKTVKKVAKADRKLTDRLADARHHRAARVAGQAAEIADQPPLIALSAATALVGLATRRPELVRGGLRMLAAHSVATGLKTLIKHRVDRTRPKRAAEDGHRFEKGESADHELNSFPSGHLAGAVAVSRAAAHELDQAGLPGAVVTGAVAAAQPPAGNHYLTDMVAGAVIGWVSEAAVGALFDHGEPLVARAARRWRGKDETAA
jgi:membrane-associated phospholipid phosphatase